MWNQPGASWGLALDVQDITGVCSLTAQIGAIAQSDDLPAPTDSSWQECAEPATWTIPVDTRDAVAGAGDLPITIEATNAGQVSTPLSETLQVDDDPVTIALSTPNDPNPTVWVNHSVTVDVNAAAGPSGLSATECSVDGEAPQTYPAGGVIVNGDGVHTITCTASNNAVDPDGNHNSSSSSVTVRIDEAPPALSFEPQNPNDPAGLVADASDQESGVAGGTLEIAPANSNSWTALPTTFGGGQLVAHFDDAGLHGPYVFKATSCDNVSNCASITKTLMVPVRMAATSSVSVQAGNRQCASEPSSTPAPAALPTAPRTSGGVGLAKAVLRPHAHNARTAHQPRAREPRAVARLTTFHAGACSTVVPTLASDASVAYGEPVTVHGVLIGSAGLPLADQPVNVLTAPDNGSGAFAQAASVTTAADGSWSATLPAGSSRIIQAAYPGSATILPATGQAEVVTPAKVVLTSVTPDRIGWGGTVRITGQVLGGYVPQSSKLLRLDLGPAVDVRVHKIQGIPNISADGQFSTMFRFPRTSIGIARLWFTVSTLTEADFPFSPAPSQRLFVTVGVPPQRAVTHRRDHARRSRVAAALARHKHDQPHPRTRRRRHHRRKR
ncbi:MAG: hypothetical protein ABSG43_27955 [Solirubrobacteraceae bacterium]